MIGKKIALGQTGMSLQGFEGITLSISQRGCAAAAGMQGGLDGHGRGPLQSSAQGNYTRTVGPCSFMQGTGTTLDIPAKRLPKQSQKGTKQSPAPGKRANSPMADALSESVQVLWEGELLGGRGGGEMGMGCRGFIL